MLRLLIAVAVAIAAWWFLAKDGGEQEKAYQSQRESLEQARETAKAASEAAAAVQAQADAIRDAALPPRTPEE